MARTGKIARLKKEHRDALCALLRDGATALRVQQYVKGLVDAGERDGSGAPIEVPDDQNVTNWRQGGYLDWLKEEERRSDMRFKREFALQIVRENEGSKLPEAALHVAASQIYEALTDFDLGPLKELLADKPENYAHLVNSLAKLTKGSLEFEKYRNAMVAARVEVQKLKDPSQNLSDDDRRSIINKVDEILGIK